MRRAEEVRLDITGKMRHRIDVALGEETYAALPGCQAEFVRVAGSRIVIGNVLIGRCDVGADEAVAEHAFKCDETAGCDADAIDVKTGRARDGKAAHRQFGGGETRLRRSAERTDANSGGVRDWLRRRTRPDGAYLHLRLLLFARLRVDLRLK